MNLFASANHFEELNKFADFSRLCIKSNSIRDAASRRWTKWMGKHMDDTTKAIETTDVEQIRGYAKALEVPVPPIHRLPVDSGLGGRVTGIVFGRRPTFVFLHGGQLNAHTWDSVILRAAVPAIAYDLPGHGHSLRLAPDGYSVTAIAELVTERILADTDTEITLIGHSFGAMVGILIAAKLGRRVNSLILLDATPHGIGTAADDPETIQVGTFDELVDSVHARVPQRRRESLLRGVSLNTRRRMDGLWEWCWDLHFKNSSHLRVIEKELVWAELKRIQIPTTLVRGERSEKVTTKMIADFKDHMPTARTLIAPGAGHNVHTDAPGWTAQLVVSDSRK